jgi:hypothetical protein
VVGSNPKGPLLSALTLGDGARAVQHLQADGVPLDALQLVGDCLVVAFRQHVVGAEQLIAVCVAALQERGWDGDSELMEHLDELTGLAPAQMLRPLPIDLEQLASALEGDPVQGGGRIDLSNGEVWPQAVVEYESEMRRFNSGDDLDDEDDDDLDDDDVEDDPDDDLDDDTGRWLSFDSQGSHAGFDDMGAFIATMADRHWAGMLEVAIGGRGPFRRFRDVIGRWPDEMYRFLAFSDERKRGRARQWLAEEGFRAMPPRREKV